MSNNKPESELQWLEDAIVNLVTVIWTLLTLPLTMFSTKLEDRQHQDD